MEESEGVSSVCFCEHSYTMTHVRNPASKSLKHGLDDPVASELASAQGRSHLPNPAALALQVSLTSFVYFTPVFGVP